jgi:hypothetical protein
MPDLGVAIHPTTWHTRLGSLSHTLLATVLVGGGIITQTHLFYAEAAVAALVGALLLLRPSLTSWALALIVATTALTAVILYRYVDIGAIGPIPDLYEPTWQIPGKVLAAYAEGMAAVLSIPGVIVTLAALRDRSQVLQREG